MAADRPSDLLKNKTNVHPVVNRSTQATAEDFVEAGAILDNHADLLNALINTSGADFYGIFATLAALQAAYPIGPVINEGSYAIITLGVGNPIEIAVYTNPAGWQIVDHTDQVLLYTNRAAFPPTGLEKKWYIDKAATRAYLWYNSAYNLMGSNAISPSRPFKKNFLPLSGVDLNQDLLAIIADAILLHAPWTCAAGQKMEFYTANVASDEVGSIFEIRHYVLNMFITEIGVGADISITGNDIIPLGKITNEVPDDTDSGLVAALGNIGTTDLEDAFNAGKLIGAGPARGPWVVGTIFFVTATQDIAGDDVLKRYIFQGAPGLYGGDDMGSDPNILEATLEMFQDITEEPTLPSAENNIIVTKTVLDDDLLAIPTTVDAAGLAVYFNALDPALLKQGYESWRINIVDDTDAVLKTFDLVNRGKGLIGDGSPLTELDATNFFEININRPIQITHPANFTLDPTEHDVTIISEGKICTIDLINKDYPIDLTVAMKNDGAATSIVIVPKTGWSYQLNALDAVSLTTGGSNITLTWAKGGTCTVIRKGATNKIMIDGGIE